MVTHDVLIEALPCAYIECDDALRMTKVNQQLCDLLGKTREELIGRTGFEVMPETRDTVFEGFFNEVLESRSRREIVADFAPLGGSYHIIAHPYDGGMHIFITDVTKLIAERDDARAQATELERTRSQTSVIVEGLREGIVMCDAQGEIVFANAASSEILGQSILGQDEDARQTAVRPLYEDGFTPVPVDQAPLMRALRGEYVDLSAQLIITGPDQRKLVSVNATPLRDEAGTITGALAWFRDITQVRQQSRELEEGARRYRAQAALLRRVIDGLEQGLVVLDRNANIVLANTLAQKFLGPHPEGRHRDELISEYQQIDPATGRVLAASEDATAIALTGTAVLEREIIVRSDDLQEDLVIMESSVPLRDEAGEIDGAILWFRDVTAARKIEAEREELKKRLSQAQKMEAVGQLAGGIAHDFNNLLTVILGNAEALIDEAQELPSLRQYGEISSAAAMRAAELTHRLLAFSRQQPLEPKVTDIDALLSSLEALVKRSLGESIDLQVRPEARAWQAIVDPGQLENAIINLAVNARDAMPDGGRLTIEASHAVLDDEYCQRHTEVMPGEYVSIAVSDTGSGMPPEIVERVFEPFFTTKEVGRGTGLGLSMVYGFVKQSGGHVRIYSEIGEGTTVTLLIPRAVEKGVQAAKRAQTTSMLPRGNERIALVEDDLMVRSLVELSLTSLGYTVASFENGPLLLSAIDDGAEFDLLLTDVVLPAGMNGRVLAEQVCRLRTGVKVLYMSGYTENAIVHHGRLDQGVALLHKPFQRMDLATKVRGIFDTHNASGDKRIQP